MTAAAQALAQRGLTPKLGIVLGSGLGALTDDLDQPVAIPYAELPGFPEIGVAGHGGQLVLGHLNGLPVAALAGRKHAYEGDPAAMKVPIRTLKALGADTLLVTNAAGSLREDVGPGRLMAITDHINMLGSSPLTGPNEDEIGPRFPSMRDAYDPQLIRVLRKAAKAEMIDLAEGVYLATAGPAFETPAEIRAFRVLGADAVGMSTVPEVILARHAGLRVVGVSAITNLAEGMGGEELSHEQTLRNAHVAARDLVRLVERFAGELDDDT
ncbi:purine-nucleoside phosphorylase [Candidatus Solirubrobacter pratensis]|uniref:purine-nucleoside phosphorylase n=1 Tax=Candidatus Solirubrobacter pratensis TaxID=1298857 RepID=UPI00041D7FF9|nr:purine-nucleoside phosphorylase [Candidatus Solirubrobacter pratensis]